MDVIFIVIIVSLIFVAIASLPLSTRDNYKRNQQRESINYSKDYMNNPIVRDMNERDRNL